MIILALLLAAAIIVASGIVRGMSHYLKAAAAEGLPTTLVRLNNSLDAIKLREELPLPEDNLASLTAWRAAVSAEYVAARNRADELQAQHVRQGVAWAVGGVIGFFATAWTRIAGAAAKVAGIVGAQRARRFNLAELAIVGGLVEIFVVEPFVFNVLVPFDLRLVVLLAALVLVEAIGASERKAVTQLVVKPA